ncbi:MAG: hypothetical protein QOH88_1264 [Verrucomicrobiota bacterium]|jgi:hypothetical protein
MKLNLLIAAILYTSGCAAFSQPFDKNKPHARICVAVVTAANGDEEPFQTSVAAAKGRKIVTHIDATAKCEVVVAAFNRKDRQLAFGWPPQFVQVSEKNELAVPKTPMIWSWEKDNGPIDFYVLVFAPGSKEAAEFRTLIGAMQNPKSEALAKLQTNKLHELIGRVRIDEATAKNVVKTETAQVGGVFRVAVGFEWRDSARSVNFTAEKPGALIFPGTPAH